MAHANEENDPTAAFSAMFLLLCPSFPDINRLQHMPCRVAHQIELHVPFKSQRADVFRE